MRSLKVIVIALAGLAAAGVLFASPALGTDIVTGDPVGDLNGGRGLTKKERQALDIASVHVVGEEGLGLFVTVTFKGNLQQRIGRGHLKDALVALVLQPMPGAGASAGLVTAGAGSIGETFRKTASKDVAVIRDGRRLHFVVLGPGFGHVESISVRTFARGSEALPRSLAAGHASGEPPVASRVAQLPPPTVKDASWDDLKKRAGLDNVVVAQDLKKLRCEELDELERKVRAQLEVAKARESQALAAGDLKLADDIAWARMVYTAGLARIAERRKQCETPPAPAEPQQEFKAEGSVSFFDPTEILFMGAFVPDTMRPSAQRPAGAAPASIDAIKIVVPGSRQITAFLCPAALPNGSRSQTTSTNDTLTCSGGTLQVGQQFTFNVRTSPNPSAGMGVQLFGRPSDGAFQGPFAIPGP
jgi:hypothetical protein